MDGLIIGRTVHYVYAEDDLQTSHKGLVGTVIPATIVNAAPEPGLPEGTVNLTGQTDGPNHGLGLAIRLEKRPYSPYGEPGTWYWPQDGIQPKPVPAPEPEPVAPVAEVVPATPEPEPTPTPAPTPEPTPVAPEQPPAVTPAT